MLNKRFWYWLFTTTGIVFCSWILIYNSDFSTETADLAKGTSLFLMVIIFMTSGFNDISNRIKEIQYEAKMHIEILRKKSFVITFSLLSLLSILIFFAIFYSDINVASKYLLIISMNLLSFSFHGRELMYVIEKTFREKILNQKQKVFYCAGCTYVKLKNDCYSCGHELFLCSGFGYKNFHSSNTMYMYKTNEDFCPRNLAGYQEK